MIHHPSTRRIIAFRELHENPVSSYPDISTAARINGVSRQAISYAISTNTRVHGLHFLRQPTYDRLRSAELEARSAQ